MYSSTITCQCLQQFVLCTLKIKISRKCVGQCIFKFKMTLSLLISKTRPPQLSSQMMLTSTVGTPHSQCAMTAYERGKILGAASSTRRQVLHRRHAEVRRRIPGCFLLSSHSTSFSTWNGVSSVVPPHPRQIRKPIMQILFSCKLQFTYWWLK
jgi:hypothetical protein